MQKQQQQNIKETIPVNNAFVKMFGWNECFPVCRILKVKLSKQILETSPLFDYTL